MTQTFCGNCGTGLPHGGHWCHGCGVAVASTQAVQAHVQQSYPGQAQYAQQSAVTPAYSDQAPYAVGAPPMPQPAAYAPGPYGAAPYAGGPGVPPQGWGALEGLLSGDWAGAAKSAGLAVLAMLGV